MNHREKKFNIIIILFFIILFCNRLIGQLQSSSLQPKVDHRLELISIAYNLANKPSTADNMAEKYRKDIYNHFKIHANHPFVLHIKELADSLRKDSIDISNWELPSLALHVSAPPFFDPLVESDPLCMDGWDDRSLLKSKTITLLKQFYIDSHAARFFKSQAKYYKNVNSRILKQIIPVNKEWFDKFFAVLPTETFSSIVSLHNHGVWNYIRVNFSETNRNTHTILGCEGFDKSGMPTNDFGSRQIYYNVLHEYTHAFTNQLIDNSADDLKQSAEIILSKPKVWEKMKGTFYGNWKFLLYESLVRAITIKYILDLDKEKGIANEEILTQEKAGFFWIDGLVKKLEYYSNNRHAYKTMNEFMPEIIQYFNSVALM